MDTKSRRTAAFHPSQQVLAIMSFHPFVSFFGLADLALVQKGTRGEKEILAIGYVQNQILVEAHETVAKICVFKTLSLKGCTGRFCRAETLPIPCRNLAETLPKR